MKDKIEYPEHLSEEIIRGALFVHNAEDKDDDRVTAYQEHGRRRRQ